MCVFTSVSDHFTSQLFYRADMCQIIQTFYPTPVLLDQTNCFNLDTKQDWLRPGSRISSIESQWQSWQRGRFVIYVLS